MNGPCRIFAASVFFVAVGVQPLQSKTPEERGLEIAIAADKANSGFKGEKATLQMELINAHGDVVKRTLTLKVLEMEKDGDKAISNFQWPPDVKGTKLLTWSHKTGNDDQWLYLPAIKRIKRISSRNKSGSFMGSEFSYEDFGSQEVEEYSYRLIEEGKFDGRDVWVMERKPVDKLSGYSRQLVWLDKQYSGPLKIEYYDRKGELLKVATFKGYQKIGKFWRFKSIHMDNVQTKKKSILTWDDRQLLVNFDEQDFESGTLEE
ncbi:MAG: outer membrane lipoprotein-sorting protein [Myxococcota bacterium]